MVNTLGLIESRCHRRVLGAAGKGAGAARGAGIGPGTSPASGCLTTALRAGFPKIVPWNLSLEMYRQHPHPQESSGQRSLGSDVKYPLHWAHSRILRSLAIKESIFPWPSKAGQEIMVQSLAPHSGRFFGRTLWNRQSTENTLGSFLRGFGFTLYKK